MKSKISARLVRFLLRRSPRNQAKNINSVLYLNKISLIDQRSDERYIAKIIQNIELQDIIPGPFDWNRNHNRHLSTQHYSSKKKQITKKQAIQQMMEHLKKPHPSIHKFIQAEQLILLMNSRQVKQKKRSLMYIYKIVSQNKEKYQPVNQDLADALVKLIIKKLYISNQEEEKSRKFRVQKVIKQLLIEARTRNDIGDITVARQHYEEIFRNQEAQQNIKIEALQFLCTKSIEKGDIRYLNKIAVQVKQKGNKKHQQFVNKFLQTMKSKVRQLD